MDFVTYMSRLGMVVLSFGQGPHTIQAQAQAQAPGPWIFSRNPHMSFLPDGYFLFKYINVASTMFIYSFHLPLFLSLTNNQFSNITAFTVSDSPLAQPFVHSVCRPLFPPPLSHVNPFPFLSFRFELQFPYFSYCHSISNFICAFMFHTYSHRPLAIASTRPRTNF